MSQEKAVQIRIKEEEKDIWKSFVDESDEFSTMSKLIKKTVGKFVRGELVDSAIIKQSFTETIKKIGTVLGIKEFDNFEERIKDIEEKQLKLQKYMDKNKTH